MHILLFIIYGLLCIYGILKIPFIRNSGIRPLYLLLFFGLHVGTGLLHNVIAYRYYPEHGDIWNIYQWSLLARHRLIYDQALFLADNSTWSYITHNGIVWVYMILNTITLDNMVINTLIFSFPVFLGNIALLQLFRRRFPNAALAAFIVFCLPSTLFWTACIHREAVLYMLLGFLLYSFDRILIHTAASHRPAAISLAPISPAPNIAQGPPPARKHFIIFLISSLLTLYFRFPVLLSLLPALITWLAAERRWPRSRLLAASGAILIPLLVSFFIFPDFYISVAGAIAARQQDFSSLEGHSRLSLPIMDGTWGSMAKVLPFAIRNGLFEPLPGSGGQIIYLAFSIELMTIWLIIIAALLFTPPRPGIPAYRTSLLTWLTSGTLPQNQDNVQRRRGYAGSQTTHAFTLFCIIFSLSGLMIIGAIVPFAGTIVRYRSIFLPFLVAPALFRLHSIPFIRRLDDRLSQHLFQHPKTGERPHSY